MSGGSDRSEGSGGARERERARVGLCVDCLHARPQDNARGSLFWRCTRADVDARFARYPPLPVLGCPGFEARRAG